MTFPAIKATPYVARDPLSHEEMNRVRDLVAAVDGGAGGDYSPSSPIVLKTGAERLTLEAGTVHAANGAIYLEDGALITQYAKSKTFIQSLANAQQEQITDTGGKRYNTWNQSFPPSESNGAWIGTGLQKKIRFYMTSPTYGTITAVNFRIWGNNVTEDPTITFNKTAFTGAVTNIGSLTSGTPGALAHTVTLSGLTEAIDMSANNYYVEVTDLLTNGCTLTNWSVTVSFVNIQNG